jgi:hypothetical protein
MKKNTFGTQSQSNSWSISNFANINFLFH